MSALTATTPPAPRRRWWPKLLLAGFLAISLALALAAEYILHHAEPILRKRITETLAARFDAPVTLDSLSISLLRGLEVNGDGLQIGYLAGTAPVSPAHPMIAVAHFQFRTGLRALLGDTLAHRSLHLAHIRVDGLDLHIPPPRNHELEPATAREPAQYVVIVDQLECRDVRLFLEPAKPDPGANGHKPPLEFNISSLTLENVGKHQAMRYDAQLINSKPAGAIHAIGHFGPWANQTTDDPLADGRDHQPGNTPIDGNYTFDHADLSTIKGIAGTLSSTGHFTGVLDRLAIDGHTDTPNFSLEIANHPVPLHTDFHAIVDGTTGDTYLQPVHALLGGSAFTTSGRIVKIKGGGHDIQLAVEIPRGRVQDFLRLAIKTSPPLMNGTLAMRAQLHIPPGNAPVPQRLSLAGAFTLTGVQFNNPRWQSRIDTLSTRAQLSPAAETSPAARSGISANLTLERGVLGITGLRYSVPGVLALMNGVYSADGKLFEFKGRVRTEATASQMVGGWKGLLLSPFDHYLQKNGAGIELPVEISGTGGDLHFGLATEGTDIKPSQLLADIKAKTRAKTVAKQELGEGRDLLAKAGAEDTAAAGAPTLEEAQRHHNNAVRLRAEAGHLAQQATHRPWR